MAASSNGELTGDGREDALNLAPQGEQDTDGDHGNEGENQGVLHESLALPALHPAQRNFGASNNIVDRWFSPPLYKKISKGFRAVMPAGRYFIHHLMCQQNHRSPKSFEIIN
jgi:hypothetical protein